MKFREIGKEVDEFGKMNKSLGKVYDNIQRVEDLAKKIISEGNAYRARHLVRNLEKSQQNDKDGFYTLGETLQGKGLGIVSQDARRKDPVVQGLGQTLEYLSLSDEEKENFSFDREFGGIGLYETIKHGDHEGTGVLAFGKVGGNANLNGTAAAYGADIEGSPKIEGYNAAKNSTIHKGANPQIKDYRLVESKNNSN